MFIHRLEIQRSFIITETINIVKSISITEGNFEIKFILIYLYVFIYFCALAKTSYRENAFCEFRERIFRYRIYFNMSGISARLYRRVRKWNSYNVSLITRNHSIRRGFRLVSIYHDIERRICPHFFAALIFDFRFSQSGRSYTKIHVALWNLPDTRSPPYILCSKRQSLLSTSSNLPLY